MTKHWSDCAVNSEPAYPAGECDCGGFKQYQDEGMCQACEFGQCTAKAGCVAISNPPPKQEQGEPVAVRQSNGEIYVLGSALVPIGAYLYTTPQQRKPLTIDRIEAIGDQVANMPLVGIVPNFRVRLARAIETAHDIKDEA